MMEMKEEVGKIYHVIMELVDENLIARIIHNDEEWQWWMMMMMPIMIMIVEKW